MHLSKITDYDKPNLLANNPAAGAVDMWVTGQFQLSTYPSAHKYYGDIFAEQLGVTLSLNTNTLCIKDQPKNLKICTLPPPSMG